MKENTATNQERQWYIAKSNELIQRSRYSLSLQKQKMLLYMISKVKPRDTGNEQYAFDIKSFCKAAGVKADQNGFYYTSLKRSIQELRDKSAWITTPSGSQILFAWLDTVEIVPKSGTMYVTFSRAVQPYLFDLQRNYTQYRLLDVLPFKSKYSIRLYELLKSHAFGRDFDNFKPKEIDFRAQQLAEYLGADSYQRYFDLRKRVLQPAIAEINEYSSEIYVELSEVKIGKKVDRCVFSIEPAHALQVKKASKRAQEKLG